MIQVAELANGVVQTMGNGSNWSVTNFLNNVNSQLRSWGGVIVAIIGVIMVIVAIWNIGKGLMGGGRGQVNWVLNIILFLVGGALAFTGGWGLVESIADGGASTLNELGGSGTIVYEVDGIPSDAALTNLGVTID